MILKINRTQIGLFFCAKFQSERIWIPPTLSFSTQLFKNIYLGNFIQIWFRFQKFLHVILNAPGVQILAWKFHFKKSQNFTPILSRFHNLFIFCLERFQMIRAKLLYSVEHIRATSDTLTWSYRQYNRLIASLYT